MTWADDALDLLGDDARRLAAADPMLARAYQATAGRLPFQARPPGFGALVRIILEQQVSLASAAATWAKLEARLGTVTPAGFLTLDDATLRACGFSRQKTAYVRELAADLEGGRLDLDALAQLDEAAVIERLCRLKGIGRWSAENYLLWSLGRRDVFPAQDLGLLVGWQWLAEAPARPTPEDLRAVAAAWQPRRTAAALLIWGYYLARVAARKRPAMPATTAGAPA